VRVLVEFFGRAANRAVADRYAPPSEDDVREALADGLARPLLDADAGAGGDRVVSPAAVGLEAFTRHRVQAVQPDELRDTVAPWMRIVCPDASVDSQSASAQ
jgi:hypothetical protein